MSDMYFLLVFSCLMCGLIAQVTFNGPCKVSHDQMDSYVDILSLLGLWYQQGRIANYREHGQNSTMYFFLQDLEHIVITHTESINGVSHRWNASVSRSPDLPRKFMITFPDLDSYSYYVVATNYKEYALVYGCKTNNDKTRNVFGWLLSRTKKYIPTLKMMKEIRMALRITPDLNVTWLPVYQSAKHPLKSTMVQKKNQKKKSSRSQTMRAFVPIPAKSKPYKRIGVKTAKPKHSRPPMTTESVVVTQDYWKKLIHLF